MCLVGVTTIATALGTSRRNKAMIWLSEHASSALFESRSAVFIVSISLILLSVIAHGCFFCMFSEAVNETLNANRCMALLILVLPFIGIVSLIVISLDLFLVV